VKKQKTLILGKLVKREKAILLENEKKAKCVFSGFCE